ncbi:hypothetical protein E2320_005531, partial [Naja naja]
VLPQRDSKYLPLYFTEIIYSWVFNAFPSFVAEDSRRFISQETGNLYISKVQPSDVGSYICLVKNTVTNARVLSPPTPLTLRTDVLATANNKSLTASASEYPSPVRKRSSANILMLLAFDSPYWNVSEAMDVDYKFVYYPKGFAKVLLDDLTSVLAILLVKIFLCFPGVMGEYEPKIEIHFPFTVTAAKGSTVRMECFALGK